MFVCSIKPRDLFKRLLLVLLLILATSIAIIFISGSTKADPAPHRETSQTHDTTAQTNQQRVAFLESFGWEVSKEPLEIVQVAIPKTFGDVYKNYNAIQTAQGFDLEPFKGKQVTRYTYEVKNYPGHKEYIRANMLVYGGKIIGGDVCSVFAKEGFMHGFALPEQ